MLLHKSAADHMRQNQLNPPQYPLPCASLAFFCTERVSDMSRLEKMLQGHNPGNPDHSVGSGLTRQALLLHSPASFVCLASDSHIAYALAGYHPLSHATCLHALWRHRVAQNTHLGAAKDIAAQLSLVLCQSACLGVLFYPLKFPVHLPETPQFHVAGLYIDAAVEQRAMSLQVLVPTSLSNFAKSKGKLRSVIHCRSN